MAKIDSRSYSYSSERFYEKPAFQYIIVIAILLTLVMSILAFANTYQLKKAIIPRTVSANDFLKKLTSHAEMKAYVGIAPLNIIQINNNNFANLQSQISGLDVTFIGNFIVQYADRIVIYNYDEDQVRGIVSFQQPQQGQLPADFSSKLNKHPELQGLQSEQPIGGQIDAASLETLRQQFPEVYKDAKIGDFLLRYSTRLVIYDYNADRIVNAVDLA